MPSWNFCVYGLDDPVLTSLPDFRLTAKAESRSDLQNALTSLNITLLVIDLDVKDALDAIVEALEIVPSLRVVGVTGQPESRIMIAALRAGCRQFSTKPVDANDLTVAMRKALDETPPPTNQGRVIATIGAIGGAGSTTIACYLAMGLAEVTSEHTLILDLDFDFGSVA
ncbi:MAG: hypothetical protein V3T70_06355, partial [Phycisphaerae bacterium]